MPLYNENYLNKNHQDKAKRSAREIIPLVIQLIQPKSVIDVGCGIGIWLSVFKKFGVEDVYGVDGEWINKKMLKIPEERFKHFDLRRPFKPDM